MSDGGEVAVSLSSYVLGRLFGPEEGARALAAMLAEKMPWRDLVPAVGVVRTIAAMRPVSLRSDVGASHIAKCRSRHFCWAYSTGATTWVTVDDDVTASPRTLRWLLEAVGGEDPRICIAPCVLRGGRTFAMHNVEWSPVHYERELSDGGRVRRAVRGGLGLVAMNRSAMHAVAGQSPTWWDGETIAKAPFAESWPEQRWLGEDLSFFERATAARVTIEALVTGETRHAERGLRLDDLMSPEKETPREH